jgi:hypothetical protein
MLQYLINDHLPGFNLPKLCTTLGGVYLNSFTSEIRHCGCNSRINTNSGMIALLQGSCMWAWVLYDDLTYGLISSNHRLPLTYEEAVSQCLLE